MITFRGAPRHAALASAKAACPGPAAWRRLPIGPLPGVPGCALGCPPPPSARGTPCPLTPQGRKGQRHLPCWGPCPIHRRKDPGRIALPSQFDRPDHPPGLVRPTPHPSWARDAHGLEAASLGSTRTAQRRGAGPRGAPPWHHGAHGFEAAGLGSTHTAQRRPPPRDAGPRGAPPRHHRTNLALNPSRAMSASSAYPPFLPFLHLRLATSPPACSQPITPHITPLLEKDVGEPPTPTPTGAGGCGSSPICFPRNAPPLKRRSPPPYYILPTPPQRPHPRNDVTRPPTPTLPRERLREPLQCHSPVAHSSLTLSPKSASSFSFPFSSKSTSSTPPPPLLPASVAFSLPSAPPPLARWPEG